jgi:ATP-binding cassette subfamily F protein uup
MRRRRSYKEQRELDALPATIEALESQQADLARAIADPAFYRQDKATITTKLAALDAIEGSLAAAYARWEALEAD